MKVIICDCDHKDILPEKAVFERHGIAYEWLSCRTQEDVIEQCRNADVLLNQYIRMDKRIFAKLPALKQIVRYGVGYDNVNLQDASDFGIQVCNVPDYGVNEVAGQAMALMMALVRKTHWMNEQVHQGRWDYRQSIPIHRESAQTLGVLGVGRIGSAFVRRAQAFGYSILACDVEYKKPGRHFPEDVPFTDFEDLLERSDILSVHCSLNQQTENLFGLKEFQRMKRTAYFINVSRGGIVDERALDTALSEGWIAGAALDVCTQEPLPKDHFLLRHKNLLITPHMAWYSEEAAEELKRKCAEEAVHFLQGEPVQYPVNQPTQKKQRDFELKDAVI